MAFIGTAFKIFGAFKSKRAAQKSEREHKAFILKRNIKGRRRFLVLKKKG